MEKKGFNSVKRSDLLQIDPRQIQIEENFNTRVDYGDLDELMNSIIENGVKIPLRGYKEGDLFILTDGHRRLKATMMAIEAGNEIARVPFLSEKKKTLEERIFDIILSNDGKNLTPLELGETYRRLMNFGLSAYEIAKRIGKSINHVTSMTEVASSSTEIKENIKEGNISATLVAEIKSKVKDVDEAEEIINTTIQIKKEEGTGKVTKKDLKGLIPENSTVSESVKKKIEDKEDEGTTVYTATFTELEVKELLRRQIVECSKKVPLSLRAPILRTDLVLK